MNSATHNGNIRQTWDVLHRYGKEREFVMPYTTPPDSSGRHRALGVPLKEKRAYLHAGETHVSVAGLWLPEEGRWPVDMGHYDSVFEGVSVMFYDGHWIPADIGWSAFSLEKGPPVGSPADRWLDGVKLLVDIYEGGQRTTRYAFKKGIGYVDDVVQKENVGRKMTRTDLRRFAKLLSKATPVTV